MFLIKKKKLAPEVLILPTYFAQKFCGEILATNERHKNFGAVTVCVCVCVCVCVWGTLARNENFCTFNFGFP